MNGILVCSGTAKVKNIGDYIQSVAQEQFYNCADTFVEREHLDSYSSNEETKVIMNGWFMHHPNHFPPSESIHPLFVSFHIVPRIETSFFTKETINYLKKYEPIGARDTGTLELLHKYDIKSYFSGCLTLTLGLRYKSILLQEQKTDVIFVDPYYRMGSTDGGTLKRYVYAGSLFLKHFKKAKRLYRVFAAEGGNNLPRFLFPVHKLLAAASFYDTYSKLFSDKVLFSASYITHTIHQQNYPTNEQKMEYARTLITRYSNAKMVFTSRIHCALPCLGVETPVVFINSDSLKSGEKRSGGRFGGLIELFHVLMLNENNSWEYQKNVFPLFNEKIDENFTFENPKKYKVLRDSLIEKVQNFIIG